MLKGLVLILRAKQQHGAVFEGMQVSNDVVGIGCHGF